MASTLLNKINRQWSAVVCWALTLFVLSVIPSRNLPRINIWDDLISTDKLAHAFVYGVFAVLLYQALKSQSRYAALLATSLAIFFGATMELLQAVINTGRSYDLADMLANSIGALVGISLLRIFKRT